MRWFYKIGKKDNSYALFEYFETEKGDGWTEDPVIFNWYESKEELVEDIKTMLGDLQDNKDHFDYS